MNEFEFLRGLPFGPYLPVDSQLHRLDPRTRIILVILFMGALTAVSTPPGLILGLAVVLIGWRLARVPMEPLLRGWVSAMPFLLILAAFQVFFRVGGGEVVLFSIGPFHVSWADLWAGAALLLRFSAFIAVLGLSASFLSESELTRALEALLRPFANLGLPVYDLVMVIQVTLRFFPLLSQTAERIAKAQASRGADWRPTGWNIFQRARQVIPLIVPLFVTSLHRAENMGLAMDARGYGSQPHRTSMVTLRFQRSDAVAFGAAALVVALMFIL